MDRVYQGTSVSGRRNGTSISGRQCCIRKAGSGRALSSWCQGEPMTLVQLWELIYIHFQATSMFIEWKLYRRRSSNISNIHNHILDFLKSAYQKWSKYSPWMSVDTFQHFEMFACISPTECLGPMLWRGLEAVLEIWNQVSLYDPEFLGSKLSGIIRLFWQIYTRASELLNQTRQPPNILDLSTRVEVNQALLIHN